jgi:primosomal protein N' (replication factor Y)
VLNADTTLQIPDFRSSENLFGLITQVAGRSGRGDLKGEVILQTFMPDNATLSMAANGDYVSFYQEELQVRRLFHYPPFTHLIKFTFSGPHEALVQQAAEKVRKQLIKELPKEVELLPLAPSGHAKVQDSFRFQFLIKMERIINLSPIVSNLQAQTKKSQVRLFVDVDPLSTFF